MTLSLLDPKITLAEFGNVNGLKLVVEVVVEVVVVVVVEVVQLVVGKSCITFSSSVSPDSSVSVSLLSSRLMLL